MDENITVSVLGQYRITAEAWEKFARGEIDFLQRHAKTDDNFRPVFKTRFAEICFKLGELADRANDSSLANFLSDVRIRLEEYSEKGLMAFHRPGQKDDKLTQKKLMDNYVLVANQAMKAKVVMVRHPT